MSDDFMTAEDGDRALEAFNREARAYASVHALTEIGSRDLFVNPSEVEKRVQAYLERHDALGLSDAVHGIKPHDAEPIDLSASDLHALLDMLAKIRDRSFRYYAVFTETPTDPADQALNDINDILMGGTQ